MTAANPFREVTLNIPSGMFGGDASGMIDHLGLYGRDLGGGRWSVRPNDDRRLVTSCDLADETGIPHHYERLEAAPASADIEVDEPEWRHSTTNSLSDSPNG